MQVTFGALAAVSAAFFFAGILDAVSGGGGLITIPVFMLTGFPVHLISGTNQCSTVFGTLTSMIRYIRAGKMYWFTALISAPFALAGSFLGAKLNLYISEAYLRIVMMVILPVMALIILLKPSFGQENTADTLSKSRQAVTAMLIGFILGAYVGFYGVGGGTLILMAFSVLGRLDLVTASANTRFCSLAASISATVTYAASGAVVWEAVIAATVFNIVGNYIGAGLAIKSGAKVIRPMFITVLLLLFLRLLVSVIFGK